MAAEAACLGTPAIFVSPSSRRGYIDALEQKYGAVATVRTAAQAMDLASDWLEGGDQKQKAQDARARLVEECEDPLRFMLEVIERYSA